MDENLARQAELALERQGDYDSLFFEGTWHSSGQLADRAARLATGLADLGVRPGDRLLVLMANCPEVLITYTAAWRAGAVVTPLIFLVSEDELRHALNNSGAVGIVTTVEFLPKVTAAVKGDGQGERGAGAPRARKARVGRPGSGSRWCPGPRRPPSRPECRCSTSTRWPRPSRGPSSAGRAPTWPPCATPVARRAGRRAFRSRTRACTGAVRPSMRCRAAT